jgi:eukaryotic-like serine/threonine-protein kinase
MQANVYSIDGTPLSPERFDQLQDLFVRALEQGEAGRAAFLQQACAGDEALRREVDSLLAEEPRAGNFMEGTLDAVARELISTHQRLTAGVRIGHYEITSFLDAGGMGEVYRARDTRLKRDVAIKVLSSEWSQDADRVERFKREAETLAALNHPRIAQIYGLEESGDTLCLILEFVEGDTLADRLAQGALPLAQSLDLARQIAEALEAAHERGIVHRDLKPANVKLTPDGKVKVLDFGLAKVLLPQPVTSQSPTIGTGSLPGLILGTAGYMAPEQAKGRNVDARSDIWAFGCVLYEMLVGKTAFPGESVVEVLSAILHIEPDWNALPATTTPAVRSLLQRCLQKDPRLRLRDIADARFQIEDLQSPAVAPVAPAASRVPSPPARERAAWIAAVAILAAGVVGLSLQRSTTAPLRPPEMRLQIVTPPEASPSGFSLSPDGRNLVYTSQSKLWLRPLDSEKVELLPGTEGSFTTTFWSPDSLALGFATSDHLKRFDMAGKLARTLSNVPAGVGSRNASWNGAGNLLIGSAGDHLPLYLFSSSNGGATEATQLAPDQTTQGYPYFLPDGNHFLLFARTINGQGIYVGSLDSKQTKHLFEADSAAVFAPPDYILFARRGALLAQRLDLTSLAPVGEPVSLASEVFVDTSVGSTSVRGILAASASSAGVVAFRARGERTQLAWVNRAGQVLKMITGTDRVSDTGQGDDLSLSPDGHTVAFAKTINGNKDIWLIDLETEIGRRFTFADGWDGRPVWSPDSKQLIFSSLRKGVLDLYQRATSGTEPEKMLLETHEGKTAHDWSRDGRYILYQSSNPQTSDDLWALPVSGKPSPVPFVQTDTLECCGRFSPDGRFAAYQSWETGRSEIYVQSFMGAGSKQRISTEGGTGPRWRRDGKELFYRAADGNLMSVSIDLGVAAVKAGPPTPLFRLPTPVYVPSLDGKSFLTNIVVEPASPVTVLLNWDPTAKRRAEN